MPMEQIHITLPDGSVKEVPKGTTPADVARSISPRLADAALVARVAAPDDGEGELIDLRRLWITTSSCKSSRKEIPMRSLCSAIPRHICSPLR